MDMHPCAGCHDPNYEHHWLFIELMAAFDCALNQSVPGYRTGREQYNTCVGFRGVVPHAHETRGREDTGEGAEPARCAVLVTGCAEQQERQPQQRKQQQRSRSSSPFEIRFRLDFVCGWGRRKCTWYHGVFLPGNGMQT